MMRNSETNYKLLFRGHRWGDAGPVEMLCRLYNDPEHVNKEIEQSTRGALRETRSHEYVHPGKL